MEITNKQGLPAAFDDGDRGVPHRTHLIVELAVVFKHADFVELPGEGISGGNGTRFPEQTRVRVGGVAAGAGVGYGKRPALGVDPTDAFPSVDGDILGTKGHVVHDHVGCSWVGLGKWRSSCAG